VTLLTQKKIYLDHSATTPLHPDVIESMLPFLSSRFGNPSSIHGFGREAREGIESARIKVASALGARPNEIIFTSGGTEADNIALLGLAEAMRGRGKHIVTSGIEHAAVLYTCRHLEEKGFSVTYLPVDRFGRVDPDAAAKAFRKDTILVSIMLANNEIGTIQPVAEIARAAAERGVVVHSDAVQALGKIPCGVDDLGVNLLSVSAHKLNGPKGVGALYIREGTTIRPLFHGGHQERDIRNGTENVAGIVGFGKACEISSRVLEERRKNLRAIRDAFQSEVLGAIGGVHVNGHPEHRLPHLLSISIEDTAGDAVVRELDKQGIAISAGAACHSQSVSISHVISATGLEQRIALGTVRISFGLNNTRKDAQAALSALVLTVEKLRAMKDLEESLGGRRCT